MNRLAGNRLVVLAVGAGLLLVAPPASATGTARDRVSPSSQEGEALRALERAVAASWNVDYRGTQYVTTWQDTAAGAALVDVSHRPGARAVVREADGRQRRGQGRSGAGAVAATAALDARRVRLLAGAYDLLLAGTDRCAGRTTSVVEARSDDGRLAGRFWVDRASGLLLRREVHDEAGRRVRSNAFVDLDVRSTAVPAAGGARREPVGVAAAALRDRGWHVPRRLPGGFGLLDARRSGSGSEGGGSGDVVHLAYSDGLSTTSLFAQRGELGTAAPEGFRAGAVGRRPVWVREDSPERVVWSGGGQVWTLVSDAPEEAVRQAVGSLPRDRAPDAGLRARLGRGLHRIAAALDPTGG